MLQLLVFDARRGNSEGQEDDKVLAWFPSGLPPMHQSGLTGLLHGLLLFTASFTTPGGAAQRPSCDSVETDSGTWVLLEAEPHIWFAALAPQAWLPRHATESNLRSVLVQMHLLTTVLCGSVQGMLEKDPEGSLARLSLQAVLQQAGQQLSSTRSWQHRELRNPLMDVSLPPLLHLTPGPALAVQCLTGQLTQAGLGGRRPVAGVMLLYGPHLLWSSLPARDTAALFALIATGLLHASSSSGSSGASGGGSGGAFTGSGSAGVAASDLRPLDGGAWLQLPSGFLVQRGTADSSSTGSTSAEDGAGPGAPAILLPVVHLQQRPAGQQQQQQQGQEPWDQVGTSRDHSMDHSSSTAGSGGQLAGLQQYQQYHLLPFLEGKLLVAMVLGSNTRLLTAPLLSGLHALLAAPAKQLAAQIAEEIKLSKAEASHLPGFRYLYRDASQQTARATPRAKVSAMSHHGRHLAASMRDSLDRLPPEPASGAAQEAKEGVAEAEDDSPGGGGGGEVGSFEHSGATGTAAGTAGSIASIAGDLQVLEVMARSSQDCWVSGWRPGGRRQLLAVRERRTEQEAGEAADVMHAFAASNFLI